MKLNKLLTGIAALAVLGTAAPARADFFDGMRGPNDAQLDQRVTLGDGAPNYTLLPKTFIGVGEEGHGIFAVTPVNYTPKQKPNVGAGIGGAIFPPLAIPGAILGGMGGEGWKQYLTGNVKEGTLTDMADKGLGEGILEGITAGVGALAKPVVEPAVEAAKNYMVPTWLRSTKVPGRREISQNLAEVGQKMSTEGLTGAEKSTLRQVGSGLSMGQMRRHSVVGTMEEALEAAPLGTMVLKTKKTVQKHAAEQMVKDVQDEMWKQYPKRASIEQVEEMIKDTIVGGEKMARQTAGELHEELDRLFTVFGKKKQTYFGESGNIVDLTPLYDQADKLIDDAARSGNLGQKGAIKRIAAKIKNIKKEYGANVGFAQGDAIRSDILDAVRLEGETWGKHGAKLTRAEQELKGAIDRSMKTALDGQPKVIRDQYALAKATTRKEYQKYRNRNVRKAIDVIQNNQTTLIPRLFKEGNTKTVRTIRQAVSKVDFNNMRAVWLDDIIKKSMSSGEFNENTFRNAIKNLGPDMQKEVFGSKEQVDSLFKIADTWEILNQQPSQMTGLTHLVPSLQLGAIAAFVLADGQITTSDTLAAGQGVAVATAAPTLLSYVLANPRLARSFAYQMTRPGLVNRFRRELGKEAIRDYRRYRESKNKQFAGGDILEFMMSPLKSKLGREIQETAKNAYNLNAISDSMFIGGM